MTTTLIVTIDDGYYYDMEDDFDMGGLVAPKDDCPHIATHVKFRMVHGEMILLGDENENINKDNDNDENGCDMSSNDNDNANDEGEDTDNDGVGDGTVHAEDNDKNIGDDCDGDDENENERVVRQQFQRLNLNTPKAIKMAYCQHFDCMQRRTCHRRNQTCFGSVGSGEGGDDGEGGGEENKSTNIADNENDNNDIKLEEENENDMVGENWLCLECGLLHCSRYQFGHAKLHYETTTELQLRQQQEMVEDGGNAKEQRKEGGSPAEGHCIAVSMADLSVWCYECNSYLRHPFLYEITKHLEGLKFGSGKGDRDEDGNVEEEEGGDIEDADADEADGGEADEVVDEMLSDNSYDREVAHEDGNALSNSLEPAGSLYEQLRGDALGDYQTRNEAILSSSASSSTNSIHKRKGQPPKRRAPDTHNHDWSYQKFKPDDGDHRTSSNDKSNIEGHDDNSSLEGGDEDEEVVAAFLESQHGDMLRAYLNRHESFDTSNMGQCVPMHLPRPPSFPDEMADFLRSPLCKSIIVLAGAGMSVSCGIPDFRSAGVGLYHTLRAELLTASAEEREFIETDPTLALDKRLFLHNPLPMLETKRSFILGTQEKRWKATLAHRFVELLHTKLGKLTRLYTQNIDGLELQTAIPKKKVVNVHGSMGAAACELCGHGVDFDEFCGKVRTNIKDITGEDVDAPTKSTPIYCEACGEPTVKPDIVLFTGSLPKTFFKRTAKDLPEADLLIVMGTSLSVAPANSLVYRIPSTAVRLIMNNEQVGRRLGIDYSDSAIRDVWAHGSTDESCLNLAEKMGWLDDLTLIMDELPDKSARLLRERLAQRKAEVEDDVDEEENEAVEDDEVVGDEEVDDDDD
ncbi:hypothetical protein ACHAXH_000290, partial [Discostella pseudostelligera]